MDKATPDNLQQAQTYIDFVKNNLEPLAQHLKVSVQWLWDILVMQARVEAIVWLIVTLVLFTKAAVLLTVAYKHLKKARFGNSYSSDETAYIHKKTGAEADWSTWYDHKDQYDIVKRTNKTNGSGYVAAWTGLTGGLIALVSSLLFSTSLPTIVTGLVNPEFRAIEKIVEYAKPATERVTGGE